ncbi:MAG: hypothetical protein ACLFUG_01210, partial [Nitriliruptoraceae bacterium]
GSGDPADPDGGAEPERTTTAATAAAHDAPTLVEGDEPAASSEPERSDGTAAGRGGEGDEEPTDATTVLRLRQGPRARPD